MWELKYTKNLGAIFSLKSYKDRDEYSFEYTNIAKYEKTFVISYHSLPKIFKFIIQLNRKKEKNTTPKEISCFLKLFHMFIL